MTGSKLILDIHPHKTYHKRNSSICYNIATHYAHELRNGSNPVLMYCDVLHEIGITCHP